MATRSFFLFGMGLSHKVGANHIHQVTTEVTIEFSFSQKQREKCISILQQDAKNLSHHLYHYCQRIYQSIGSGYSQLTLAQIKQLAQQELQKYRQQIGLTSSIRFEAAEPLMKLSDLLNEFCLLNKKTGLVIAVYTVSSLLANI